MKVLLWALIWWLLVPTGALLVKSVRLSSTALQAAPPTMVIY